MIVDIRKTAEGAPPYLHRQVEKFKFLFVNITDKLKWPTHTDSVVKKAQ
jgi:hypothetical protein